jgi:hypothetical protein
MSLAPLAAAVIDEECFRVLSDPTARANTRAPLTASRL